MSEVPTKKAILVLDNGSVYKGSAAGFIGTTAGEICFNTGMTGYQEVFTDPSYSGQIMVTTNAHIGNYGTKYDSDEESDKIQISGLICKNFTNDYSRHLADIDLQGYFEAQKLVCIYNVDTRAIVKEIRNQGAMNCIISSEIDDVDEIKRLLAKEPSMKGLELASKVTTKQSYTIGDDRSDIKIAVYDFGTKRNILRCFESRGTHLKVFPAKTPASELIAFNPDGFFLSNGPGDPAAMDYAIENVKQLIATKKPIFGICLGHQLLALSVGVGTHKMHHGHRGINHPVINLLTGKCEITSQNHGFGVNPNDIDNHEDIEITHKNLNDESIEGIRLKSQPAFSVQYHPEAAPGPHDSRYLFDQFIDEVIQCKNN
jgi:carbamoyl-phosphate synthase small subunit